MAKPIDVVIESVRYKNGQIQCVRVYERRGVTYSDRMLLDRKTLLERLQKGQQVMIGARQEFFGGTFKFGKAVTLARQEDREFITTGGSAPRDELEGTPFF